MHVAFGRGDLNGGCACLQLISRALEKVKRERQEELKALREARQAQQAKHAAKQGSKPGEKQRQDRSAPGAEKLQQDKSQQQSRKCKHEHEHEHKLPLSKAPEAQQAAPAKTEPSRKAESLPGAAAAVEKERQQRVLSADGLPEAVRLEAAAQLTAPAAAADRGAHRAGPAAEDSKAKPAGKGVKAGGGQKRKRQLVNDSSDDEAAPDASRAAPHAEPAAAEKGAQQQQATPAKTVQRAKSTTPAPASRAQDEDGVGPNADESVEKEHRKMREALEKVCFRTCFPCTTCHPASYDDLPVHGAQCRCLDWQP